MRLTVLERLECRRVVPYDPDNHAILDRSGSLELQVAELVAGRIRLRFHFKTEYVDRTSKQAWGFIEGEAVSTISSTDIEPSMFDRKEGAPLPETLLRLVEGAYDDEILTPASLVARAAHLPGLLRSAIDFQGLRIGPLPAEESKHAKRSTHQGVAKARAKRAPAARTVPGQNAT